VIRRVPLQSIMPEWLRACLATVSTVKMAFSRFRKGRERGICMGERKGTVTSKQALILSTCYSNKSSDKRKQATTSSLSTRISKTYQNIIKFKWCGSGLKTQQISGGIFRYLAVSPDICGHLQISTNITHTSTKY